MVIISYTILLSILGVRYAFAIAILAGLARFVPYVGPVIVYIVMALVTLFQGGNYFNLQPIYYTLLTIALSILMDQIYDNLISPRIMGRSLGVHPADDGDGARLLHVDRRVVIGLGVVRGVVARLAQVSRKAF